MIHRLFAGHFDADAAVSGRELRITRPIDIDKVLDVIRELKLVGDGHSFQLGKDAMTLEDGYVDCPWLTMNVNRESVAFMLRLNEETNCMFIDLGHGELVDREVLEESLGQ